MNYKMIGYINALLLGIEAVFMLPAMMICFFGGDRRGGFAFFISIGILAAVCCVLLLLCKGAKMKFYAKEGLVCVGIGWIFVSLFGSFPFLISGAIPNFIDAFFESASGFTTTGSSVLSDVEALSGGMNYWRCFTHWLGGMGMLVFLLAVAPIGNNSGFTMHILRAESPGPNVGKLVPKMRKTATILYEIYIALTILNFVFLLFGGMSVLDSLCTAFATAGTGGFGIRNDSIAGFSPYIQWVCIVFMLLFGVNFTCYYLILMKRFTEVFLDEEFRFYWGVVIASSALIAWNIYGIYENVADAFRLSSFQVATIITTTGFSTADFNLWPEFSKAILLILMAFGACAGSTGGGFKCARVLLICKSVKRTVKQMLHPNSVQVIRANGQIVDEKIVSSTNIYLGVYSLLLIGSFLLLSLDPFVNSPVTSFTAALSCLNNIGPGLDRVGPIENYGGFHPASKLILITDMLAGRLEIFPILTLFFPSSWKKR